MKTLKHLIPFIIITLLLSTPSWAAYKYNPHTGKLDYYQGAASGITFDPGTSGLTSTNVEDALKELAGAYSTSGTGDITSVGDCLTGAALDGTSDGGTYIKLYDGDSNWTEIIAGNSAANLTWTTPTAYPAGNNYLLRSSTAGVLSTVDPATFQTANSKLTDIAALAVTDGNIMVGNGSTWVAESGSTARTSLGAQASDQELSALAGLTSAANSIPYFTGDGTAALITSSANIVSLLGSANYATARTNLGVAIGSDVEAWDYDLDTLKSGITGMVKGAGNGGGYSLALAGTDYLAPTAIGVTVEAYDADLDAWAGVTSSANGRSLVSAANYAAMRGLLDLEAGNDFNAYNATLAAVAAGTYTGDDSIATVGTITAGVWTGTAIGIAKLDIAGGTRETVTNNADLIVVYDTSGTANRTMTKASFLAGISGAGNFVDLGDVELTSNTTGCVYQWNSTSGKLVNLGAGATGTYLKSNGAGQSVSWDTPGAGGDMLASVYVHLVAIEALAHTDGNIIVGNGTTWVAESGATALTSLGAQAANAGLLAIAGLATTDGNIIVGNGATWVAESGATALTSLGAQAANSKLTDIAALAVTDSNIMVANGSTWVAESGATARTSLGVQAASAVLDIYAGISPSANVQTLLGATNFSNFRDLAGLEIGADIEIWDADLDTLKTPTAWRMFYSSGTQVITELALGADGTFLESNGASAAPAFRTIALSDIPLITPTEGGTGVAQASDSSTITITGAYGLTFTVSGAAGFTVPGAYTYTFPSATSTLAALAGANTWTGNNTFGDADTDTLTIRSMLIGGNSRALQIAASLASPTYATTADDLYIAGTVECAGTIYADSFISTTTGDSYIQLNNNSGGLAGSGYRIYFETESTVDILSFSLNGSEKTVGDLETAQTVSGLKTFQNGLYVGDASTTTVLRLYDGSSNYWTIAVPALAGNYTLTLPTDDGNNGQALITDGSGTLSWGTAGGAGNPAGSDTQVQFNDGGSAFGADAGFVFNKTTDAVTIGENGVDGTLVLYNESGGTDYNLTLQPGTQTGAATITFPGSTSTLMTLGLAETVTGAKTFGDDLLIAGGVTLDSATQAAGDFGYASNTFSFTMGATAEDLTITSGSSNVVTFASTTSATFTFTPAVTITGALTCSAAASVATTLNPDTDGGASLGTTNTLEWQNLFLNTGGTINWENGDVIMTHSANTLAFTGASSGYTFDAAVTATQFTCVATSTGPQTLVLAEDLSNGTGTVTVTVGNITSTGYTLTLPVAVGGTNYLLNSGTAGVMGWTDPATFALAASAPGDFAITGDLTVTGSDITLGAAGVKLTGDGDGAITFLGLGDGSDESLIINLDDTADSIVMSSGSGATNINFSALNLVTTGTISGAVQTVKDDDTLDATQVYGMCDWLSGGAETVTLPAAVVGMNVVVYASDATVKNIDPNGTDTIVLTTVALTAGYQIESPGAAGDFIALVCFTANQWTCMGRSGVWVSHAAD